MARKISFLNLRTDATIKKGSETNITVDASGSSFLKLKYNAMPTSNKDINKTNEAPIILSRDRAFVSFIFGNVSNIEIAENHSRYGNIS